MNNQSKIIAALLAGVAVGAVVGLLFSPEKGEENREGLAGWFKDIYDLSKEKTSDLAEKGMNAVNKSRNSAESQVDHAESALGV
ncbi:MAG: YtxH domain-containing protein [Arcticibacter sp.]